MRRHWCVDTRGADELYSPFDLRNASAFWAVPREGVDSDKAQGGTARLSSRRRPSSLSPIETKQIAVTLMYTKHYHEAFG